MKILFCNPSPVPLTEELGAPKILVELAEELEQLGWICKIACAADIGCNYKHIDRRYYSQKLREYLHQYADEYDVVLYDHEYLPYSRTEFSSKPLFVAHSALLVFHLESISIPERRKWKSKIRSLIMRYIDQKQFQQRIQDAYLTVKQADLVQVLNYEDQTELTRRGISRERIVVIPNGISRSRRTLFDAISSDAPLEPKVAFVGTFDYRKGAVDFPLIIQNIYSAVPNASFRFLGTAGLFSTKEQVLGFFPKELRNRIEIITKFSPQDLPELLAPCAVGIFPSYIEGCPFGVLEMLAASVPVVAYNSPGLSMILPPEYLIPPGDVQDMSTKVATLLKNKSKLAAARIWAKQQSYKFYWQEIASRINCIYLDLTQKHQSVSSK